MGKENKFEALKCENCKKDVLSSEEGGLMVQVVHMDTNNLDDVYVTCDGECYDILKEERVGSKEMDQWRDLADLKNPILFIEFIMELMDDINSGKTLDEKVLENLKRILMKSYQYVIREMTEEEKEAVFVYNMSRIR